MQHGRDNGRFRAVILDHLVFLFDRLRLLKTQLSRQALHLLIEMLTDLGDISFEDLLYLRHVLLILLQRLQPFARPFAPLDMVFEADLKLSPGNGLRCQRIFAGTNRIKFFQHLEHDPCGENRRIGPIVLGAVSDNIACLIDPGEVFVLHDNRRIGLVVFQQDIVSRTILLDEVILQ